MSQSMQVTVNGEPRAVPPGTTVGALLAILGVTGDRVAVEVNTAVVTRALHMSTELKPDDHIEVVTFVGGG